MLIFVFTSITLGDKLFFINLIRLPILLNITKNQVLVSFSIVFLLTVSFISVLMILFSLSNFRVNFYLFSIFLIWKLRSLLLFLIHI